MLELLLISGVQSRAVFMKAVCINCHQYIHKLRINYVDKHCLKRSTQRHVLLG